MPAVLAKDCSGSPATGCDHWHPATSPLDSTFGAHTCIQWRDRDSVPMHACYQTSCKLPDSPAQARRSSWSLATVWRTCPPLARRR